MKKLIKRVVPIFLAAVLLCGTASAAGFPDVDESAEYAEAVNFIRELGIMVGDENGNFNPDNTVTRAEMAVIMCKLLGETDDQSTSNDFTDVPVDHWANRYISKAVELEFVSGYGNGIYGPSDTVTYEQALTMIVRAIGLEDIAAEKGGYPNGYVETACEFGLTNWISAEIGDPLARWQVAIILYNTTV